MSGRVHVTAVSAVLGALGLTGVVLLATAPMTAPRANAAQVVMADPTDQVEPTDPTITDDPGAGPLDTPEPDPTVTVTITTSPDPTVTRTRTVTPRPTKTATKPPKPKPTATATKTAPLAPPPTLESTPFNTAPAIPSSAPLITPSTQPVETPAPDPMVSLALASPTPTPSPSESLDAAASFDDPTPDSVPIEIRNASPEYDQLTLSRKLAIPGVLLAVLVMLGVLIFEGRVRRLAHAAAVRKAGPRSPGRHRGDELPAGLPMPGYPIYHGGTAYAPIISFVPVQGYPNVPGAPQGYGAQDPQGYGLPYDPHGYGDAYGVVYEQGHPGYGHPGDGGPIALPAGMTGAAEPWPRADAQGPAGPGAGSGLAMPGTGPQNGDQLAPGPWSPDAGARDTTLQAPLPGAVPADKPSAGLLGLFGRLRRKG
ncbi:hypothetical protein ABZU32_16540 [Sphaerisporangium sp. NPDC005288]|uniref:hypothetical protein n=1 Tax=Sphaerisporangium sp. NPDC005288 TaxID=3155114 RepID=UPI0033A6C195